MAAQQGHEAVVRLLLAHAAVDTNQADQEGRTPLHMATLNNQEATVRILLDAERHRAAGIGRGSLVSLVAFVAFVWQGLRRTR